MGLQLFDWGKNELSILFMRLIWLGVFSLAMECGNKGTTIWVIKFQVKNHNLTRHGVQDMTASLVVVVAWSRTSVSYSPYLPTVHHVYSPYLPTAHQNIDN